MSAKHTLGPLTHEGQGDITGIENDPANGCVGKVDVACVYLRTVPGRHEANARRLVACWNACDGIDTDDLEVGSVSIIAKLHDAAAKRVLAERDKLLEAQQASMDAQIENEALKARLAKSGVAHRQTVAVLTNALRHIEGVALADDPRDLPGIAQTAREALGHWAAEEGES